MTFLKWAGGKAQLLSEILPRLPSSMSTYVEPFVGGGAVFFALAHQERMRRAIIGDRNRYLVDTYGVVQRQVDTLIRVLKHHQAHARDEDYFYELRELEPDDLDTVERAAWLIFLNKTCFNGLYRVNSKGRFNVPFGHRANPRVLDEDRLRWCSSALRRAKLIAADFEEVAGDARRGDAVYFDPPYLPIDESSFVAYGAEHFSAYDHRRLRDLFVDLRGRQVSALLSSSDCTAARRIYRELKLVEVKARRAISSDKRTRKRIGELLFIDA